MIKQSKLLNIIDSIKQLRVGADDKLASTAIDIYPTLKYNNELVPAGTRINYNGIIKRARVDLWDSIESNPDNAPTLWEDILYKDGYRVITSAGITAENSVGADEICWYNDTLYKSVIANNVWTPDAYPAGWEIVE